ncbi:GrpB family protein [Paenibacillus dokdonensis]|uniref:GrpB family protein n=1 Tax=Paenibacillus dokdonensis TaxID=2567944 RepID=UPI0010A82D76|nr:GrpB family protein [Paenibacillus dokdonensis]
MNHEIIVAPYNPDWAIEFYNIAYRIRNALQDIALRIDHIGSTEVVGLDAKPIIDIQISVRALEPVDVYQTQMEGLGYMFRADNTERTKRYFREGSGMRRTHIHIREAGSFSEQFALLFRDYLRSHAEDAQKYAEIKYTLMRMYQQDRHRYVEEKEPYIWEIMRRASQWSQDIGWRPGRSDM